MYFFTLAAVSRTQQGRWREPANLMLNFCSPFSFYYNIFFVKIHTYQYDMISIQISKSDYTTLQITSIRPFLFIPFQIESYIPIFIRFYIGTREVMWYNRCLNIMFFFLPVCQAMCASNSTIVKGMFQNCNRAQSCGTSIKTRALNLGIHRLLL